MPNARPDDQAVTWGRWQEAQRAVLHRLDGVESDTAEQFTRIEATERSVATAEENRRTLAIRVDGIVGQIESRRSRIWTLATILLTSLLLPLLVVFLTVWLHLRLTH